MNTSVLPGLRTNLGYVGAHVSLLAGAVGLLFLQRYIWLVKIAEQGYGPFQTATYLAEVSAFFIVIDLGLGWTLRGSRAQRSVSLLWPALFFVVSFLILIGNNV